MLLSHRKQTDLISHRVHHYLDLIVLTWQPSSMILTTVLSKTVYIDGIMHLFRDFAGLLNYLVKRCSDSNGLAYTYLPRTRIQKIRLSRIPKLRFHFKLFIVFGYLTAYARLCEMGAFY